MQPINSSLAEGKGVNLERPKPLLIKPQAQSIAVDASAASACKVALVGFGTVGSALGRLLYARQHEQRLALSLICNRNVNRKRVAWTAPEVAWTDNIAQVLASDADVVVELTGDLDFAYELVSGALRWGKAVVTANKQLIAHFGSELLQLARDNGQYLGFGACVAGGVPVLSGLQEGLAGDRLVRIQGILNGTCNYILSRIELAADSFADALRAAQQAGFAEADPTFDLDGQDAAAKLAILARVGLKVAVAPDRVPCRSIRDISVTDFEYAHELGCTIRQISTAILKQEGLRLSVGPALVSNRSPLALVSGSQNLIVSTGEFGGDTVFAGQGAGGDPTAVAVLSDLIQAARCRIQGLPLPEYAPVEECCVDDRSESPYFIRFIVRDQPGIIAALASVFARHGMNIGAIHQRAGYDKACLPFVITLETCTGSQVSSALNEISHFDFLVDAPLAMPIVQ